MKKEIRYLLLVICALCIQPALYAQDQQDGCKYFIPNTLTPDCDAVGCEILEIVSTCSFCEFSFTIFDRFGAIHFESKDPKLKFDCTNSREGTYFWQLHAKFCNSSSMEDTGVLMILK